MANKKKAEDLENEDLEVAEEGAGEKLLKGEKRYRLKLGQVTIVKTNPEGKAEWVTITQNKFTLAAQRELLAFWEACKVNEDRFDIPAKIAKLLEEV